MSNNVNNLTAAFELMQGRSKLKKIHDRLQLLGEEDGKLAQHIANYVTKVYREVNISQIQPLSALDSCATQVINQLEEAVQNLEQIKHDLLTLIHLTDSVTPQDSKNIVAVAQDTFRCCVCLEVSSSPMIQCPKGKCRSLLGCQECIDQWVKEQGTCPKCRGSWPTKGTTKAQHLRGMDEFLDHLSLFQDNS